MNYKNSILSLCLFTMLFASCREENTLEPQAPRQTLTVVAAGESFVDKAPITRALPAGYTAYNSTASIGIFLAPDETSDLHRLDYVTDHWHANINIEEGKQYYVYGLMPRERAVSATITSKNGTGSSDYANGAVITANGVNTLSNEDICTIVGVKKGETNTTIADVGIEPGQFGYLGSGENQNYMYILLKHLYAALHFRVYIDEEYSKVRTIKVKSMTLSSTSDIHDKVNIAVTLTANGVGTDPITAITYTSAGELAKASLTLFDNAVAPFTVPLEAEPKELWAYFAPYEECSSMELYSVYDVYDRKGNLIRKDCTVHNKLDIFKFPYYSTLGASDKYIVNLKIEPTYLYMLGDPDLDNPTIKDPLPGPPP